MEERQLNFNQPLLSVRRGSSSMAAQPEINHRKSLHPKPTLPPLPYYKSDMKSGPVRNPGVVPFQWEQMPGRPKDENLVPKDDIWQLAVSPKLPPGRISNHIQKPMDKTPKNLTENKISPALDIPSMDRGLSEFECSEKDAKDEDISSSGDDNVTFVDPRDTLSRSTSSFNCSVSGVSAQDDPSKACSGVSRNSQTRDFMMTRFLPAAKTMASEASHYASRKHSAAREQLKPVKKQIKWKKEDDQEDEGEYAGMDEMSEKLCGLLPKFCLLNPILGMRELAQATASVRSVRTRPVYVESCRKIEKKDRTVSHRGDMKIVPHQHASKKKPLVNENFGSRSITPLKDGSPQYFHDKEKGILGLPEDCGDLRASKLAARVTTSRANPANEKTLYVDSEPIERCRNSISSSSESRGRNPSVDSLQDIKFIYHSKSSDTNDSSVIFTSQKSFQDVGEKLQRDQVCNLGLGPILPKSPSESWLSRTLPSMSLKNPYSKSYLGNLAFKSSTADPKRERMLRTNLQHMAFQPARGLGPILEN